MSWKKSTIGDVLYVIKNGINCEQNKIPVGEKITRIETIANKRFDFERVGYANLTESEKERSQLKVGDILFSHINSPIHVGKTAIYEGEEDIYHGINLLLMRTNEDVNPNFFNHFLNHLFVTGYWEANCKKSVNQASVNQKDISKVEFNYPPLSTQQKVVEKLDAIFAEIDKSKAASEANAKNAEALFQSYLNEKLETNEEGWISFSFDEIIFDKQIGLVKNSKEQVEDGVYSYFKMNNITNDNKCNLSSLRKVNSTNEEVKKYSLKKNDFLFNTRNSVELVGKVCIFDGEDEADILYNNNIMRIRFKPFVNPYFILYAFSNKKVKECIEMLKTGTTNVAAIYYKDLKDLKIQVPDLATQNKIVSQINNINSFTNMKSLSIKNKLQQLYFLKKSILQKAFRGDLVKE